LECWSIGKKKLASASIHYSFTPLLHPRHARQGFTLLEVMIAVVILAIAMTVAGQLFAAVTRSWTGARTVMDRMHHGDFVLGQLSASLRSMAFFTNSQEQCGFRIENNSAGEGAHTISWVTASSAFIPPGEAAYSHGLHRIEVGGGKDEDGVEGLVVTVWPYLADEEKVEKKSWLVSENIKGLSCQIYDTKDGEEGWKDKWEYSNAIPGLVEITLYAEPAREYDDPVKFRQIIEIPLGPPVTNDVSEAR
jgi:type II secretion system protein J